MSEYKILTLRQAAQLLQIKEREVGRLLRSGYLRGCKLGRGWRISLEDLNSFIRKHGNVSRGKSHSGNAGTELNGAQLRLDALRPRKMRRSIEATKPDSGTREVRSDQSDREIKSNWVPPWREDN